MTPFDYANQISELDPSKESYRQEVEKVLRRFAADELCKAAILIDDKFREGRIAYPSQAAKICRKQAQIHTDNT